MDLGLAGKTAVVLGGTKGIGRAIAEQFLMEGAKVAICARKEEELKETADSLKHLGEIYYEVVDVSKPQAIYDFAEHVNERFGGIHAWINNVGVSIQKKGEEIVESEIDQIVQITFKSQVFGCQAAFRYMKNTGGAIVNISSLAARCPSAGHSTLYGPMKAGVRNLTQTMAGEYSAYGVRVNCVMPGFTITPAVQGHFTKEYLDYSAASTLLNRLAVPSEIAGPVVFLCGKQASYMTGTTIEVVGGRGMTLNPTYSWELKAAEEAKNAQ